MDRRIFDEPEDNFDLYIPGRYIGDGSWVWFGSIDMLTWEHEDVERMIIEYDNKGKELRAVGRIGLYYLRFRDLSAENAHRIQNMLSFSKALYGRIRVPDWERALEIQEIYRCTAQKPKERVEDEDPNISWELCELQWIITAYSSNISATLERPFEWLAGAIVEGCPFDELQ